MFANKKSIKYGGNNDVIENECPRCGNSCDKHKIQYIEPNKDTDTLVEKMQNLLDEVTEKSREKKFELLRNTCMVGSAIATINSGVYQFVTISGKDVDILNHIKSLGKSVTIITTDSALPLTTIQGKNLNPNPRNLGNKRDYLVGSCAAQKLLMAVFTKAGKGKGHTITALNMSERLWTGTGEHNRDWSTGNTVGSCDTCKQVIPMMLCDQDDD